MAIRCLYCYREYDVTLFGFDRTITCLCGKTVTFKHEQMEEEAFLSRRYEDRKVREIGDMACQWTMIKVDFPNE